MQAKVQEKIVKGDARDALCDTVKKVGADFLVIGSHGYGTFKRYVCKHYQNFIRRCLVAKVRDVAVGEKRCINEHGVVIAEHFWAASATIVHTMQSVL